MHESIILYLGVAGSSAKTHSYMLMQMEQNSIDGKVQESWPSELAAETSVAVLWYQKDVEWQATKR
ncbi:hypothetical protein Tdes44962_MAKER04754 [Teratosphaeria destructans]|uniref:Uncharacterized protein n=1 Tax=Teratosphaeria destructans TaxID=418781 RepID=A0A9W7SLH0_9PEZI|nr:hypothetical protein Tdes44962_MAKER04754 [Teratosphaeria destructans]